MDLYPRMFDSLVAYQVRCLVWELPGRCDDIFPSDDNNWNYTREIIYISSIFVDKGLARTVLFQKRWTVDTTNHFHHHLDYIVISCTMWQSLSSDKILVQLTVSSRLRDVPQITSPDSRAEDVTGRAGPEVPGGRQQGGRVEHGRGNVRADRCRGADVDQKFNCEER